MNGIDVLIDQPVIQAVGWALLHFVWQGALLGALAAAALRVLRRSAPDVRYAVAAVALTLMATMPVVTGVRVFRAAQSHEGIRSESSAPEKAAALSDPGLSVAAGNVSSELTPSQGLLSGAGSAAIERWLPLFVLAWLAGVVMLALRLAGGWIWLQRMTSHDAVPADNELQALVRRLNRRLHIGRTITLLRSPGVDVPTVIGWIRPTVLLPMCALSRLSPLQIEAILAHELAHVRRHDYLVNLLQTCLETLLFYHPAVWWLSRQIRTEREHCCDDLAVSLCGDPVVYARALAELEEQRGPAARLVLAASGGPLLQRVRRLLTGSPGHAGRGPAWLAASAVVLLMLAVAGAAVGQQSVLAATAAGAAQAKPLTVQTIAVSVLHAVRNPWAGVEHVTTASQVPPAPSAPPAPPDDTSMTIDTNQDSTGNFTWTSNGDKLEVKYRGSFELNDDDTSIVKVSPNGFLRINDGAWFKGRSGEFTADGSGVMTVRYRVGGRERAFEPEGRQWLAETLPKFIRMSGFAAKDRVARYLRTGGVSAVLEEISRIPGSHTKKVYFSELLKQATLDAPTARRVLEQAGREITSNHELATLLIAAADTLLIDDEVRKAYFETARRIQSDYEMRRVLTAALGGGAMSPVAMTELLAAARALESDHEAASLLLDVVKLQAIEGTVRSPFFAVLETLQSSHEKGRVLQALLRRPDVSADTLLEVLTAAGSLGSGHEASQVLQAAARAHAITGPARDAYLKVADRLGRHEQDQALAALVRSEKR